MKNMNRREFVAGAVTLAGAAGCKALKCTSAIDGALGGLLIRFRKDQIQRERRISVSAIDGCSLEKL
jgi:hypothetical protein